MTERTIAEWQKAAHDNARSKGFHDCRLCVRTGACDVTNPNGCPACNGTGLAPMTPTRIGARLAGIHAAISRAYECVARGEMKFYWLTPQGYKHSDFERTKVAEKNQLRPMTLADALKQGFKPEGFGVKLADVFLRLCDLAESLGARMIYDFEDHDLGPISDSEEITHQLNWLHREIPVSLFPVDSRTTLQNIVRRLHMLAIRCGVDLLAMAELKHSYNLIRPRGQ